MRRIRRNRMRALKPSKDSAYHIHLPIFRDPILDETGNLIGRHSCGYCLMCGRAMKGAKQRVVTPTALNVT